MKSTLSIKSSLIVYFLICCSCLCGCSDYGEELSGDYFYMDESKELKMIENGASHKKIYPTVVAYDCNKDFIVAKQIPNKESILQEVEGEILDSLHKNSIDTNYQLTSDRFAKEAQLKIETSSYFQEMMKNDTNYWIIAHQSKQMYGPLTRKDYLKLSTMLSIPNSLKLK
jgi:hypothetical protein